ncbi:MAG TPA: VOC family protein, partial [Candidatus Binataceae bacterium]|nr:VOC family protein [Candidatus Binataceae bacterium]
IFLESAPYLLVDDVFATAEYYRDVLGFSFENFFGDPPSFVIVRRNAARIMFRQVPQSVRPAPRPNSSRFAHTFDAYIWVSDVDRLAEEIRARGAEIIDGPGDDDGRRLLLVRDLNGYHIAFGRVLSWPN